MISCVDAYDDDFNGTRRPKLGLGLSRDVSRAVLLNSYPPILIIIRIIISIIIISIIIISIIIIEIVVIVIIVVATMVITSPS